MNTKFGRPLALATMMLLLVPSAIAFPSQGDMPPQYVGIDLDRQPVTLESHNGKAIVISFWASWCPYCLKELPILHNIQNAAGKEQMHVIAINTESREIFRKAAGLLRELSVEHTHDFDGKARKAYGVNGIPHMVIVGRDGKIVAVHRGYDESSLDAIAAEINQALSAPR